MIEEIKALIKKGLSQKSIFKRYEKTGLTFEEFLPIYNQAYSLYIKADGKKKGIIYSIIAFVLIISALFILPFESKAKSGLLWAFTFGLSFGVFIFLSIFHFISKLKVSELFFSDSIKAKEQRIFTFIFGIAGIIASIVILNTFYNHQYNSKLNSDGINVIGKVESGYSETTQTTRRFNTRTTTTNTIFVSYKTKQGKQINTSKEVNSSVFGAVYEGMEIKIRYIKDYPELFEVLLTEDEIKDLNIMKIMNNFNQ